MAKRASRKFSPKQKTPDPQSQEASEGTGKKIILNFGRTSESIRQMAAATLAAGDFDLAMARPKPLRIGDVMEDGTKYAGISPDTGKPMFVTPSDAPLTMKWKEAMDYAAKLDAHGRKDWRLPS